MKEIVYSIIIPVKPEKDFPDGYYGGSSVGDICQHYCFCKEHGKVFWSWGFSKRGIKKEHQDKENVTWLLKNPGEFMEIDGKEVKIDKTGYFYSSESNSINYRFEIDSFKLLKKQIHKDEIQYIPSFRKIYYNDPEWRGSWVLMHHLEKLTRPFDGHKFGNCYEFPNFPYSFYSNPKKSIVKFDTNHLASGNAFVIKI